MPFILLMVGMVYLFRKTEKEKIKQDSSLDSAAILQSIKKGSKGITSGLQEPLWFGVVIASLVAVMFIYNCFF